MRIVLNKFIWTEKMHGLCEWFLPGDCCLSHTDINESVEFISWNQLPARWEIFLTWMALFSITKSVSSFVCFALLFPLLWVFHIEIINVVATTEGLSILWTAHHASELQGEFFEWKDQPNVIRYFLRSCMIEGRFSHKFAVIYVQKRNWMSLQLRMNNSIIMSRAGILKSLL